ncbi:beta-glucosidase [Stackebrandtia albiflava]|uniref:Beta-glucosidase n=1 Tax=Stackebrandtia albiflava TaxID=406432 RepID=A0A562UQR7_9ACTN|nr:GH1 family beta-glucosidase [Stackebrandtia albiflava]TWJ07959.1 beta-glucosidase [Stackebrandtia albiflava]
MTTMPPFPDDFAWGVATSAFQIEGAVDTDGRGPSIWDGFSHTPGRIRGDDVADTACDHYHRYREDVDLLRRLGVDVYRFSLSWSRVVPDGLGHVNGAGLDFYDRLVDALLDAGITPMPTLFHWDLPQELEDHGGWLRRDTAEHFARYTGVVAERLGDRVRDWITLNEPFEHMALGHALGVHAPGHTMGLAALPVAHHQLLAHGLATRVLREHSAARVLLTNSYSPAHAASDDPADHAAAAAYHALHHGLFTDPVLRGRYPDLSAFGVDVTALDFVADDDLAIISTPLDGLGINYYNPTRLAAPPPGEALPFTMVDFPGVAVTDFGWPVIPSGLTQLLTGLAAEYGEALPPLWITENGCSYRVEPGTDGRFHDQARIDYLDAHIRAVHAAITLGADVRGYLTWTLMDNYEWAEGYHQRFGLVHVDPETRDRHPKSSFDWYAGLISGQRG